MRLFIYSRGGRGGARPVDGNQENNMDDTQSPPEGGQITVNFGGDQNINGIDLTLADYGHLHLSLEISRTRWFLHQLIRKLGEQGRRGSLVFDSVFHCRLFLDNKHNLFRFWWEFPWIFPWWSWWLSRR